MYVRYLKFFSSNLLQLGRVSKNAATACDQD